ncbi:MAG: hypothetical protein QOJ99_5430 [Bryobacterales bacterium]|nr:hypothetical protein [Bryobacterales bacterium]
MGLPGRYTGGPTRTFDAPFPLAEGTGLNWDTAGLVGRYTGGGCIGALTCGFATGLCTAGLGWAVPVPGIYGRGARNGAGPVTLFLQSEAFGNMRFFLMMLQLPTICILVWRNNRGFTLIRSMQASLRKPQAEDRPRWEYKILLLPAGGGGPPSPLRHSCRLRSPPGSGP